MGKNSTPKIKKQKPIYEFLWSNFQSHRTIETNINSLVKFRSIIWNQLDNIIQVSRNNRISCFHSVRDLEKDVERGKLFFNEKYSKKIIDEIKKNCKKYRKFFDELRRTDFSKLSNKILLRYLTKDAHYWSLIISFFRPTQAAGTHYLNEEIKKYFSNKEASILTISTDLDQANKEQIDWQKLLKQKYSTKKLLKHAEKYPWMVACHFTYDDVIDTLTQRYKYDKEHLKFKDLAKEKKELKEKQKKIIKKYPKLGNIVNLMQKLALYRMEVKSCWAGNDFYLIPLLNEISKRTGESTHDIYKYYLARDVGKLLEGEKLSNKEKDNRRKCFVGLWRNGKAVYKSGDEAEKLAEKELKELYRVEETDEIKGLIANPGKVSGIARILESNNIEQTRELRRSFKKEQILITQMTQPNIVDIASRAGAIITDEGGMLSHAAIISRELGIPCIVGTKIATSIIKDGDLVEVDADKGIVRILKRK